MNIEKLNKDLIDKINLYPNLKIKGFVVLLGFEDFLELKNSCLFTCTIRNQFSFRGIDYDLNIVQTPAKSQSEVYLNI